MTMGVERPLGRHGVAPAAGDLVAHAGEAELEVEGVGPLDPPALGDLARKPACGGDEGIAFARRPVHHAHHLRVGGHGRVALRLVLVEQRVPLPEERLRPCQVGAVHLPGAERGVELPHRLQRVADDRDRPMLRRIPARGIDRDERGPAPEGGP